MNNFVELPGHGIAIAATPLGNIADASPRLVAALQRASVIAAEDTRRVRSLASALGAEITGRVISNFDHNEDKRVDELITAARSSLVLVVSDAGMPVLSDPGHCLVSAAHDAGIPVTCFPGPSAVPTALAVSGLNVGHFIFDGFAPRKQGARQTWLESLIAEKRAVCFFESPHRLATTLEHAAEILGDQRRAAVCRELTKTYEQVRRGTLPELAQWSQEGVRGEITVVIEGGDGTEAEPAALVALVLALEERGMRLKDAAKEIAHAHGVKVSELYDEALAARTE
ncbi:16S rRNA (cytidine(1402)-2'-O)-methyltransferase [Corynebacterium cystitidis]|uniref:Ribosomal RNA small subunit methyltransferase I n=1 Tax=Corynebacterium cystitidis DSM 20524 TaxID=1121357 RepID=A0A1H9TTQ8_9CORY|nr:16S rRNA (cytidine(1402)-2'-O)-methyltransferase [Corynebacterium cystitidis]WJY81945.1 Ribosomal RNA small subunit methyltransferase I [Corynebacterium cystitidis DSM 20524]SES00740.1 16S rRNA (cytidine1402-2'-O)-methyltransferase [Corynebacterium cystitidis DSM 20524]SNV81727.1 predicted methyltransferase [Corynebacterium cystitidis]